MIIFINQNKKQSQSHPVWKYNCPPWKTVSYLTNYFVFGFTCYAQAPPCKNQENSLIEPVEQHEVS